MAGNPPPFPPGRGGPPAPRQPQGNAPRNPAAAVQGPPQFGMSDFNVFSDIGSDNLFTPRQPNSAQRSAQQKLGGPNDPRARAVAPAPAQIVIAGQPVAINDLTPIAQFSPEWWFMYLWKEASTRIASATADDKRTILQFFNKAFRKPPRFGIDNYWVIPKGYFLTSNPPLFSADELRGCLTAMLRTGFDWVVIEKGSTSPTASSDAMLTYASIADRTVHYQLVWRGESSRSLDLLRERGYNAQARDQHRAKTVQTGKKWHPFFDNEIRRRMWYRLGQNDNCLYSSISVATDWRAAACFPKIEQTDDLSQIQSAVKNGRRTLDSLRATYPTRIGEVLLLNNKTETRLITTCKVAMMVVDGLFVNTEMRQADSCDPQAGPPAGYPELGVNSIAGSNVLGMVEFVRVHHGVEDNDGFTLLSRQSLSKLVSRQDFLAVFVDSKAQTDYYGIAERLFKDVTRYAPRGLRWKTTGFEEITPMKGLRAVSVGGKRLWP